MKCQFKPDMMFEYYSHIHVYSPGAGADNPLGPKCFCKHKYSIHLPMSCKFCPSTHILTNFPIRMHGRPMLTLQLIRSRSSEGHGLIYTNFVELHCLMLHAKFQNHRPSGFWFWKRRFLKVLLFIAMAAITFVPPS